MEKLLITNIICVLIGITISQLAEARVNNDIYKSTKFGLILLILILIEIIVSTFLLFDIHSNNF